jgi:hypothetical protein
LKRHWLTDWLQVWWSRSGRTTQFPLWLKSTRDARSSQLLEASTAVNTSTQYATFSSAVRAGRWIDRPQQALPDQRDNPVDDLKAAGYPPERADAIYITHMHADRAAGLMVGDKFSVPERESAPERMAS